MFNPRFTFAGLAALPALAAVCFQTPLHAQTPAPSFSQLIIFGDSLSDVGNDADVADDNYSIRFPGPSVFNSTGDAATDYTDGRFTDGTDTDPAAVHYTGVWHEQLATLFLGLKAADASMDGGFDFAFGGATTGDGQSVLSEENGAVSLHVDNMTRQVSDYFDANTADPNALYILWGGANDLFDDQGQTSDAYDATAIAAANNESALLQRLAEGGAKTFLVNNLPPLDLTPSYNTDTTEGPKIQEATVRFNTLLAQNIVNTKNTLASEGLTVTIYQLDVYTLFQRLAADPAAYGFTNVTVPSQTTAGATPDQYLFWDMVHPTTAGHFQLAAEAYTLLSGVPVVELNAKPDNTGFYLTRTGADVSAKLDVHYKTLGSAVSGQDYAALSGVKKIRPGKQSAEVAVTPLPAGAGSGRSVKLKLLDETTYVRPELKKATIKLD